MSIQIYRFTITRESARAGSNVIYEAQDPVSLQNLQLLEWTPSPESSQLAAEKLVEVMQEFSAAEIFSSGQRLYAAVRHSQAPLLLNKLQQEQLFLGAWPGINEPASNTSADASIEISDSSSSDGSEVSAPGEGRWRRRDKLWVLALIFHLAVTVALGIQLARISNQREMERQLAQENEAQFRRTIEGLETERSQLNARIAPLEAEIQTLKQQGEGVDERHAAFMESMRTLFNRSEEGLAARLAGPYVRPSLRNACAQDLAVAVLYQSLSKPWVSQGWFIIPSRQTVTLPVYSENAIFYFYAKYATSIPAVPQNIEQGSFEGWVASNSNFIADYYATEPAGDLVVLDKIKVSMVNRRIQGVPLQYCQ